MMDVGASSAAGPRAINEDSYYAVDFSNVGSFSGGVAAFMMVSDGMGGYQGGDVASRLAVSCAEQYIASLLDMAAGHSVELDVEFALTEIIEQAHNAVIAESAARGGVSMGATIIASFLSPNHAWIAHVGDSRAYLVREGDAVQLTEDHSQVGRMLRQGLITEREAQNHPHRNRIERALGFSDARPDFTEIDLLPGDSLVLCSDGVYTVLSCGQIGACVEAAAGAGNAAQKIVDASVSHKTDDNCTAAVACIADSAAHAAARKRTKTIRDGVDARNVPAKRGRHARGGAASQAQQRGSTQSGRLLVVPAIVVAVLIAIVAILYCFAAQAGPWTVSNAGQSASSAASVTSTAAAANSDEVQEPSADADEPPD